MNKNQKIFRWMLILFTLLMIAFAVQMGMNTTAPWHKKAALKSRNRPAE